MWRFLVGALAAVIVSPVEHALFAVDVQQVSTCPESTSWALNFGAFIPRPPGATGIQLRQVTFGRTPSDAGTLQPIFVSDGMSSVSVPVMAVQPCCVATGCDLAAYVSVNGTWPSCGSPIGCGAQSVQWYAASFADSAFGTCGGCGIVGDADLDVTFSGAAMPLADFGSGTSFYVSYEPLIPSETTSTSASPSETPSSSSSGSVSASETASPSVTKSATPTQSIGVCAQAQQRFWGMRETVVGDVTYFITHGYQVTHAFGSPPELLVGTAPTCSAVSGICRCTFQSGSTAVGCGGGRYATVDYRIGGTNTVTVFDRQNPSCYYYFDAYVGIASVTATQTASPSVSPYERAVIIADSQDGFAGTQGVNGWNYVYYSSSAPGTVAQPFTQFGPSPVMGGSMIPYWYVGNTYCMIREINMHTNGASDCATPTGYCAPAVIWTNGAVDKAGKYEVTVSAAHSAYSPPTVDGVYVWVRLNGVVVRQYGPSGFAVQDDALMVWNLTSAELVLDPIVGCNLDRTTYRLTVQRYELLPSVSPTPSATASLSMSPSPSVSVSGSVSPSPSRSVSITLSPSGSMSQTPSLSGSGSVSASGSKSASVSRSVTRSRSVSRSATRSPTMSVSVSVTGTPEFLMSRWPTATASSTGTTTGSPAFIVTPWPSPGFSASASETPAFMLVPMPSPAPSEAVMDPTADSEKPAGINTATAVGGAAVGVVGGAAVVAGVAQLLSNLRPPQIQNQNQQRQQREDRDKEPPEEELRARVPSPDDVEKLRRRVRFDTDLAVPPPPADDADPALFAFRPEDVAEVRRILAENGIAHEIIRTPK